MTKYKKIPIVVEAQQLTVDNIYHLEKWCNGSIKGTSLPLTEQVIEIWGFGCEMQAEIGDYIIKGIKGEFYPCKPDIFELTYEVVND